MVDDGASRRGVLGGAAVGLAATAVPVIAQGQTETTVPLRDPRTKYTNKPFPEQRQPWPALASKMTPRPDHGETS